MPGSMISLQLIVSVLIYFIFYFFAINFLNFDPLDLLYQSKSLKAIPLKFVPPDPEVTQPPSFSPLKRFSQAAVCSDSDLCSRIGRYNGIIFKILKVVKSACNSSDTLKQGGGAVDAAISTLFCNGLVSMQSMGPGGGMLMVYYSRQEKLSYGILNREIAPLLTNPNTYNSLRNISELLQSPHTIAVPTEIMGYAEAHARFGLLAWKQLVQPTYNLCRLGFKLSKHQHDALTTNKAMILKDKHLAKMFVDNSTKDFFRYGTHIQPVTELCESYKLLMQDGAKSFFEGELSERILQDLYDLGSNIKKNDFENVKVKLRKATIQPLGKHFLHLIDPPSSSFIVGLVMNILKNFVNNFEINGNISSNQIHLIVEALKFGFAQRWNLDANSNNRMLTKLLSSNFAHELSKLIKTTTFEDPAYYGADMKLTTYPEHGTAHICVLAPNGDAVSVTSSINFYFGAGRSGSRSGIIFNNAMGDFTLDNIKNYFELPNVKNKNLPLPGQSPMSSMAPLIITDNAGNVRLIIGAAGGSKIISALTQILVRVLWMEHDIKQAIDAPRFHHQLLPSNLLEYEFGIIQEHINALKLRGHKVKRYRERGSAVCGIEKKITGIMANVDFRKDGGVAGF